MDGLGIALRFALYLDLMVLFGVPLFILQAFRGEERRSLVARRCLHAMVVAALAGIVVSLAAMAVMTKGMIGASGYLDLTWDDYASVVSGTDAGIAWTVRLAALAACLMAVRLTATHPRGGWALLAALAAPALASLAWAGHGAMDDGVRGYLHLLSTMGHLAAAAAWIGAIAVFVALAWASIAAVPDAVGLLSRTATGFARTGTGIVAVLAATGALNYWLIVGPALPDMAAGAYGSLMLAKLAMFAGMLALAAANRYRLSPDLERSLQSGNEAAAVRALSRSLWWEAGAAVLVLALVAWLGVLSPLAA